MERYLKSREGNRRRGWRTLQGRDEGLVRIEEVESITGKEGCQEVSTIQCERTEEMSKRGEDRQIYEKR